MSVCMCVHAFVNAYIHEQQADVSIWGIACQKNNFLSSFPQQKMTECIISTLQQIAYLRFFLQWFFQQILQWFLLIHSHILIQKFNTKIQNVILLSYAEFSPLNSTVRCTVRYFWCNSLKGRNDGFTNFIFCSISRCLTKSLTQPQTKKSRIFISGQAIGSLRSTHLSRYV